METTISENLKIINSQVWGNTYKKINNIQGNGKTGNKRVGVLKFGEKKIKINMKDSLKTGIKKEKENWQFMENLYIQVTLFKEKWKDLEL